MYSLINALVRVLKKLVPDSLIEPLRPAYHATLAFLMALSYGFPAKKLVVLGVTGTKGKSTSAEMLFAMLRAAGHKTALISTIRFAIEDESEPNRFKMTLQGRGFAQMFMRKALKAGCTHVVVEITSESTLNYRHWFFYLDGLLVTNIQREHIERHGSFENYAAAKRAIVMTLANSTKPRRILVTNEDVPETRAFLDAPVSKAIAYSARELASLASDDHHVEFAYGGQSFTLPIAGTFNAMNALGSIKLCQEFGVTLPVAAKALAALPVVRGRVERIEEGQPFIVVVDYAHTPDSLAAVYEAFKDKRKICILGNTGGGRDRWKRPLMGGIAEQYCDEVILTNEDPYDEDPRTIIDEMAAGMKEKKPTIIMDRREAIKSAFKSAQSGDAVLITGKGTDPYIMEAHGKKTPWSDAEVAREELRSIGN